MITPFDTFSNLVLVVIFNNRLVAIKKNNVNRGLLLKSIFSGHALKLYKH